MAVELIDELEAGELSVEFEGEEPEVVLEWAIERFAPRIAISTAFQIDGIALLDMAYAHRPGHPRLQRRHRPAAAGDLRADRAAARALPGAATSSCSSPDAAQPAADGRAQGPEPLPRVGREPAALLQRAQGAAAHAAPRDGLDAWITGLRRDQWATRTNIRKVEIDHDHGAIVKLNPLAEWTEDEVWDYVREHDVPTHPLYEQGYTSIGCAPCTRAIAPGEAVARGPLVVGDERAEGVRHPLRDRDGRLRARAARAPRRGRRMTERRRRSAARPPRSRSARRRPCSRWCRTTSVAAGSPTWSPRSTRASVDGDDAEALEELLELGPADRPAPRALRARAASRPRFGSTASFRADRS